MTYLYALCLLSLVFATSFAWQEVKHCPFQYQMPDGSLCRQFNSTKGNRVFSECSFGDSYVNPGFFSPIEVCEE